MVEKEEKTEQSVSSKTNMVKYEYKNHDGDRSYEVNTFHKMKKKLKTVRIMKCP